MSETDLHRAILKHANLWLEHSGGGEMFRTGSGKVRARGGYVAMAPKGTADLCGWRTVWIPQSDVAPTGTILHNQICVAQFVGIEVKLPGREPTAHQARWIDRVNMGGGLAGVAHSADEATELLRRPVMQLDKATDAWVASQ